MLRSLTKCIDLKHCSRTLVPKCTFLTNEYKCNEAWNVQISSPILTKVNLNDFYNILEQNFSSKGVISAIDVDIFANAVKDPAYLDELKDLLHKLRLSAETGNTLESTHHATIRNYMEFGNIPELIQILKDPLNFGVFLDFYTANILLDKLITSQSYDHASNVASFIMLQEDFSNDITNTLCQYASYKYLSEYKSPENEPVVQENNKKKEEIKIRIKYLRNPYFDDHFDIQDLKTLSGKTLAWISKKGHDNLSCNLQIIGWLFYQKYEQLLLLCNELIENKTFKLHNEVLDLINKEIETQSDDTKAVLSQCIDVLSNAAITETKLEHSIKISIENAINRTQNKDIAAQKELFSRWEQIREDKLEEQSKRLDRANRMKNILEQQKQMQVEEQKLWFFENEEQIDLQIEEKEKLEDTSVKKSTKQKDDENYIPPEILPKRK
ncbi:uncharacterized protein LOC112053940 [Bicyclus anynana]|uniref:Uncharacterized protein LOC112053940 n=1 Tax=Bicyclus anynana TaxID=110368 RepID=A0A6J1NNM6_BICAN|nr:uncharacterized protein LOC112053940 [Bicyclus anynana]